MKRLYWAVATIIAASASFASIPALAQDTSQDRRARAERELQRLDGAARVDEALRRCSAAIDARDASNAQTWCAVAAMQVQSQHRRADAPYTASERAALHEAAWLIAVKGVQEIPTTASRPHLREIFGGADAPDLRLFAYQFLGDLRCNCSLSAGLSALVYVSGAPRQRYESMREARAQALDALLSQPHTPERLWAVAALAYTTNLERPDRGDAELARAEAAAVAGRVAPLVAEACTGPAIYSCC